MYLGVVQLLLCFGLVSGSWQSIREVWQCRNNLCENDGTCRLRNQSPVCVCKPGFTGQYCEIQKDPCDDLHCTNGGNCILKGDAAFCRCMPGYYGNTCEFYRDPCRKYICLNGGKCEKPNNVPQCVCQEGFYGENCEMSVDPCWGQLCLNGGVCSADDDKPVCKCPGGFYGDKCELSLDPCQGLICYNDGTCSQEGGVAFCVCSQGYTGKRCEYSLSCPTGPLAGCGNNFCHEDANCADGERCCPSPCSGNRCFEPVFDIVMDPCARFCKNGGKCRKRNGRPFCECLEGYRGDRCENSELRDHPGKCPSFDLLPADFCGDVFCKDDWDCELSQKCCRSPCGRRRCIPSSVEQIDPCKGFCKHGGKCAAIARMPVCFCRRGYTGFQCEHILNREMCPIKILTSKQENEHNDLCKQVCQVDSDCPGEQTCCNTPCGGTLCIEKDNINTCEGYCQNGGVCSNEDNDPTCTCPLGYEGSKCETKRERPGTCPQPLYMDNSMIHCDTDDACSPGQKCCSTECGGRICTGTAEDGAVYLDSLCRNLKCESGLQCRVIHSCFDGGPKAVCADTTWEDNLCSATNLTQAILLQSESNPPEFRPLNCDYPPDKRYCPIGAKCVNNIYGNNRCCFGTQEKEKDPSRECPSNILEHTFDCDQPHTNCSSDVPCPDEEMCCLTNCGQICTNPTMDPNGCPAPCPEGSTCVKAASSCPENVTCIQVPTASCVPNTCLSCSDGEICVNKTADCLENQCEFECRKLDKCGNCSNDMVCKDTGLKCYPEPCESYTCVKPDECGGCPRDEECVMMSPTRGDVGDCVVREGKITECNSTLYDAASMLNDTEFVCVPTNRSLPQVPEVYCHNCPENEMCVDTLIECVTTPCPKYKCVPLPPVSCDIHCPDGYFCTLRTKECTEEDIVPCMKTRTAVCVPRTGELRYCAKTTVITDDSAVCKSEKRTHRLCSMDENCREGRRCCPSKCNRKICQDMI
ncbi:neurogenic locus notch homolog protein 2-like [Physella acuta]|uniref:neurogenic locus notch homolog protein 2-like n=1 Tax=Physella acuta TaxID=109671 RepID=UPI0027DB5033|nr:neurogenic locus notch homolog protein 2-like [Physella acuta]